MDYNDFLSLVKKRRSIRRFKPDPVSDDLVDKILEAAIWAPSGFNLQPWEFVVVKDKKLKDDIVKIIRADISYHDGMEVAREEWQGKTLPPRYQKEKEYDDFSRAPVFILLFGDIRSNAGLPMRRRYSHDGTEQAYTSGLASAFLHMSLAATTLGLANQWVSAVGSPYPHCMIKELLGIPVALEIYDMMALGYPAYAPGPKPMREKQEMVHYDYCGVEAFRTDEQVREFIRKIRNSRAKPQAQKID
ncbi:nitroreductase family protein [Chloroflexota bacterium]